MRFVKEQFKSMKELIPAGIVLVFFQLCSLCMSLFYPFSKTIKGDTWTSKADWYDVMIGAAENIGDEMTFGGDETIFITPIIDVPWLAVITILVTVLFIVGFTLVAKYAENDKYESRRELLLINLISFSANYDSSRLVNKSFF